MITAILKKPLDGLEVGKEYKVGGWWIGEKNVIWLAGHKGQFPIGHFEILENGASIMRLNMKGRKIP